GWQRAGPFGQERRVRGTKKYMVVHENDAGWSWRPSPKHPTLRLFYRGYLERGYTFEFRLDEFPSMLGQGTEWATWDSLCQLLVARDGGVERYTLEDLATGKPSVRMCFEDLQPPPEPGAACDPS